VLLLALDTSTPAVSVALAEGRRVLAERTEVGLNRHGELLAPLLVATLRAAGVCPSELGAVAVGCGPGPFTGLRVGLVTAAGLADALGVPAYAMCSLDVLARGRGDVLVVTDARRREVYWAAYGADGARLLGPGVARPADVPSAGRRVVGPATDLYPDLLPGDSAWPRAADLADAVAARADRGEPGDRLTPLYLRHPDATPPGAPKAVLR
jgi:tRNA threonylcarbamoyl adenosine modification protein YeaZ